MASIIAPGAPTKTKTGITFSLYEDDEIHPSDEYEGRIDNLIERPGSAPLTKYSILPLAPGQTHIVQLATPNVMPAITYMLNATLNPNSPYIGQLNRARSNSAPNLRHRGDFPPPVQVDFYGDLKRAQRLYGPDARVLVGNLPYRYDDDDLACAVEEVFEEYGSCVACVFRGQGKSGNLRPYAIVQYTEHQDAMAAYCCGQEVGVLGRGVRVEFSRFA